MKVSGKRVERCPKCGSENIYSWTTGCYDNIFYCDWVEYDACRCLSCDHEWVKDVRVGFDP
jgi:predicted Zn-ribbon and HTH transcriptional regulator